MKIKSLIILLSIITSICTHAQLVNFADLAVLPEARSAISSANDGENIYIANGFGQNIPCSSEIFKYNIETDKWSTLTDASIAKVYASAAVIDQKLYVLNGQLLNGRLNRTVEVINLKEESISYTTEHPNPSRAAGIATWNGKIYAFGGSFRPNTYSNKLYEFDPGTEQWKALVNMPFAAETKGEIVNGKLYVFGGYNGKPLNKMAIYDIASDTWEESIEMPVAVSAHATAIIGDKIYLIGDYTNLTSLIKFETADKSFKVLFDHNLNPRRHCAAEGLNGRLYVMGGNVTRKIKSSISSVQTVTLWDGKTIRP